MKSELLLVAKVAFDDARRTAMAAACINDAMKACRNLGLSKLKSVAPSEVTLKIHGPAELINQLFVELMARYDLEKLN